MVEDDICLDDAYPLGRHMLPKDGAFQAVKAALIAELGTLKHLECVLANLFYAEKIGLRYVSIPFDNTAYRTKSRYNALRISFKIVATVKAMAAAGYVTINIGFLDRDTGISRRTRIIATPKLLSLLEDEMRKPVNELVQMVKCECIELRNEEGFVEYVDSRFTKAARKALQDYNDMMKCADITFPTDTMVTDTYRVFNGDWDRGGRFYNHRWSFMPKEQRLSIRMNGEPVVEVDYSAQHLRLLYAMLGYQIANDPYAVGSYARKAVKDAILIMLNAKTQAGAHKAITLKLTQAKLALAKDADDAKAQKLVDAFEGVDVGELIRDILSYHAPIWNFFCSGIGIILQNLDSRICEAVLKHFVSLNVPCLPVHDSFLVPASYEDTLIAVMKQAALDIGKVQDIPVSVTRGL